MEEQKPVTYQAVRHDTGEAANFRVRVQALAYANEVATYEGSTVSILRFERGVEPRLEGRFVGAKR